MLWIRKVVEKPFRSAMTVVDVNDIAVFFKWSFTSGIEVCRK